MALSALPVSAPSWLLVMREAFARARFSEAAAIYDSHAAAGDTISEALLLRARILLKTSATDAIEFLLQRKDVAGSPHDSYLRELYLGIGYSRLREFAIADEHFARAADRAPETLAERSEIAYHRARRYLLESRIADAWTAYEDTVADTSPYGEVRSETLRGYICAFAQRYAEQASSLIRTLALIARDRASHLEEWYCAVHTLAVLARERTDTTARDIALEEVSRSEEWSPDFLVHRFQALRALGWCKGLHGDSLGCFRFLREAQAVAESIPAGKAWRTIVLLDRAHFATLAGEAHWASDELASAQELARQVSWEHTTGEERIALLLFAELLAASDPEKARYFFARFKELHDLRSPLHFFAFDDRLEALSASAAGAVFLSTGNLEDAEANFKAAWSTFDRIGYDWRAAKSALALYRVTGKLRWRLLAAEKLEPYPASWLARELQSLGEETSEPRLRPLTPMQQRIHDLVCEGLSTEAMASRLGRSPNTVRNHIKLVFKARGVRSRAALVAKSMRSK
jgi:DNA-binding CsgD family transcriptional regulator/tetratricopeptide (TPR) repeat protein